MAESWDAGDVGCGVFAFELRARLESIELGHCLEVIARDPGAARDIPAWCRMAGHELVSSEPPVFIIRRGR